MRWLRVYAELLMLSAALTDSVKELVWYRR